MVASASTSLQYRQNDSFIPASTIKILTSYLALNKLGPKYRFITHFYLDNENNLFIKGFGDPYLISEEVTRIAKALKQLGLKRVRKLILDDSSFSLFSQADGVQNSHNSYDAPNGALAVNFNSIPVFMTENGVIQSAESQTPTLPIMQDLRDNVSQGMHRVNVSKFTSHTNLPPALRYVGDLFTAIFKEHSLSIDHGYTTGNIPSDLPVFYVHENSKTLSEVVKACLLYSNNFIANQLFLTVGAVEFGFPATWVKSQNALKDFVAGELSIPFDQVHITEGSGLSRNTKISCSQSIELLNLFKPYTDLLPSEKQVLVKSGTLHNVYNYAGYFVKDNQLIPFTIFLNQPENLRDQLLTELNKEVQSW